MIGSVVAVGQGSARWMFVTRVDAECVYGRMWSARKQQWTKGDRAGYARDVIGKRQPNCPKPSRPRESK